MKKIIVISSNNNPDYYFYAPYQEKAWNKLGWDLCVMITHDVNPLDLGLKNPNSIIIQLPEIKGLRTETIAQGGRLYAGNYLPEDSLIMTCDMDLIPLSDYWKPNENQITIYGHDLTDFSYFPMGYIAMKGAMWKRVMKLTLNTHDDFLRDANETKIAFAPDWESWWNFDWDLITKRIKLLSYKEEIKLINRGRRNDGTPFAFGRIDRGDSMKLIEGDWIDAHCENNNVRHPDKLNKFINIFEKVYGTI